MAERQRIAVFARTVKEAKEWAKARGLTDRDWWYVHRGTLDGHRGSAQPHYVLVPGFTENADYRTEAVQELRTEWTAVLAVEIQQHLDEGLEPIVERLVEEIDFWGNTPAAMAKTYEHFGVEWQEG